MDKTGILKINEIKRGVELYMRYWKIILFCVILGIALAHVYLRYADYEYLAKATIQIKDDKQSQKLPSLSELTGGGIFSKENDKIKDETKVMLSRNLLHKVITDLDLNIQYYNQGKIKELELYKNPPLKISFFESDSIINKVDTTLYLKIKSPTEFLLFQDDGKTLFTQRDDNLGTIHTFGDRIKTGFGDMVITPNMEQFNAKNSNNLKIKLTSVPKLVNKYQRSILISTAEASSIVTLELQDKVPQKAIDILNKLVEAYNADVLADKEEVVRVTSEFINNRLEQVTSDLENVDLNAEDIQKRNRLTALNSQADLYLQSGRQTENQINEVSNRIELISFLESEATDDSKTSDVLPIVGIEDANVAQITRSHNELVAQRDRILNSSSEKNPIVIKLNNQIDALKSNLQASLRNMKETSQMTLDNLYREDARIRGQLYAAPTKERQFKEIQRQQGIKESLYLYLLEKREESAIMLGMYTSSAKIIDNAYSNYMPVAPKSMFTYLASVLLGLAIPIGFIYARNLLDTKIYHKDDIQEILDIPYIGEIPKTSRKEHLIKKVDYSPKAEAFRIVRSNLDFMLKSVTGRSKIIFVTSTKAQEGKSHTSTNIAHSISFSEKRVLLIEMDIRVPKILHYLKLDSTNIKGLSDYIADKSLKPDDVIYKMKDNKFLDIIPSGTIPPNPSELLMSKRVDELFKYFDDKYEYIIVDTSAVGIVSDTLLVAHHADAFVYVVSANDIDKRLLAHVAQPLYNEKRLPNMTFLLNGTEGGSTGYGYGYGYGYGSDKKKPWYKTLFS
ncbi:polysaccharide biosynthesis tyrosine autokinase [Paucihalobacter ruber]|uniref:non-specific protein-tyrosine kinase n=1 Tax=Paucihalobacter ruber TaxID=2567861 RepID=A0A506PHP7_9FLAO|nr:tyrosine-protein kinase family protein [Paucihalobacter ruber]TPV33353.1 polysaccharide biosynthesis tyrosine autokinase [Paucihalobacter ruber]